MSDFVKLIIVGLAKAGKTSIYRRCLEKHDLKDIEKTPPTIMIARNTVNLEHISKHIAIWDFGGQSGFRSNYLQKPDYFDKTRIIIFVVDVLAPKDLEEVKKYFNSILQIIKELKKEKGMEPPKMYIFLHKCDPETKNQNTPNIAMTLLEMNALFGKEVPMYMTSIHDDTACRSLNNILFFSLPEDAIMHIFSEKFFEELKNVILKEIENKPLDDIEGLSKIFGDLIGQKIHELWMSSSIKKVDRSEKEHKFVEGVEVIQKDGKKRFKLKCQFALKDRKCTELDCTLFLEFLKGILNSIGLGYRSQAIEKIKDDDECFFII
ncbi:MAG: ADP-ribosylation factor-like protein [Candidatus Helarchaeota archaeon]